MEAWPRGESTRQKFCLKKVTGSNPSFVTMLFSKLMIMSTTNIIAHGRQEKGSNENHVTIKANTKLKKM